MIIIKYKFTLEYSIRTMLVDFFILKVLPPKLHTKVILFTLQFTLDLYIFS